MTQEKTDPRAAEYAWDGWGSAMGRWRLVEGDCVDVMASMPPGCVSSVVCDPPYGLAFMGKEWDDMGPGKAQQQWHERWLAEAFRVLKPGGYLIAFGGQRTIHRLVSAAEDVGFEVRDLGAWQFWSGFPKSLNLSKAFDRQRHDLDQVYRVTGWIKEARDAAGLKNKEIDAAFGLNGMAGHWTSQKAQPNVPTLEQIPKLLEVLGLALDDVPDDIRELIWTLNGNKGTPGKAWFQRETVGYFKAGEVNDTFRKLAGEHVEGRETDRRITKAASEEAKKWEGWGTALKPSLEPWTLCRKPWPKGRTLVSNVRDNGVGALNIDGCRYGYGDPAWPGPIKSTHDTTKGRWPANVYVCPKVSGKERETGTDNLTAVSGAEMVGRTEGSAGTRSPRAGAGRTAKARKNFHPTVKPVRLMRWLVRLVTPPLGVVLDPFAGSGSCGCGAIREAFDYVGVEINPEYAEIARARLAHYARHPAPPPQGAKLGEVPLFDLDETGADND